MIEQLYKNRFQKYFRSRIPKNWTRYVGDVKKIIRINFQVLHVIVYTDRGHHQGKGTKESFLLIWRYLWNMSRERVLTDGHQNEKVKVKKCNL